MSAEDTRQFRVVHLSHRRRDAENSTDGAPTNLQPGELVYGEEENKLYMCKDDNSVVVVGGDLPSGVVTSNTTGITGADIVTNIVKISQADYDALATKDNSTLYIING